MKILKSWLSDWIDLSNIEDDLISEALESLGFEIENIKKVKPNYKNIVVGKVIEIISHPNADKLRIVKVDVGNNIYDIVCGAWNFDINVMVPVALPNSFIKDDFKIDKRDLRGIESNGMICSASELDLWDDTEGILLLDNDIKPGTDFSSVYNSADTVWEIGITPNRGDCMSHLGVARELSNYFNLKLIKNDFNLNSTIKSTLQTNSGKINECNSYTSLEIENFNIDQSPFKVRYRLSQVDTRIINNVVDLTNYVLYDIGQPLHAFDRDKLYGVISVRKAAEKEKIVTLDNQERILTNEDLIITDNDKPIALAGVMGGSETEVTSDTKNILLESAYFDKVSIMKTSRRLNLISDASIRFERGIDFNIQEFGLLRFVELLSIDTDVIYSKPIIDDKKKLKNKKVTLLKTDIYNILGIDLDDNFITKTLDNLQIEHEIKNSEIIFHPPSWRYDLDRPIDLIEELAKHFGFNNFESTLPIGNNRNNTGIYWENKNTVSNYLISNNFQETQTLSFVKLEDNKVFNPEKKYVEVFNPIDQSNKYLRSNLFSSLIKTYLINFEQNSISCKLFEINNIFDNSKHFKYPDIPNQQLTLGILLPSVVSNKDRRNKENVYDIHYLKDILSSLLGKIDIKKVEKPGFHKNNSYILLKNNEQLGSFGQLSLELTDKFELKNNIYLAEVNIENLDKNYKENNRYIALSQYPYVKFDLSFSVPLDFKANDIKSFIEDELVDNENEIDIFDDFVSEKSRNLGIRINTRNYLKTYDEQETTELLNMLIKKVESKFKIKLNKS